MFLPPLGLPACKVFITTSDSRGVFGPLPSENPLPRGMRLFDGAATTPYRATVWTPQVVLKRPALVLVVSATTLSIASAELTDFVVCHSGTVTHSTSTLSYSQP
jgi:hypothetical protein